MIDVGHLSDFPEGSVRIIAANGHRIGVVRWRGEVFAVRDHCPHQGGPACDRVMPNLVSPGNAPGTMALDDSCPILVCGWHGWEFEARTGRSLWDENYRLKTYPVRVEEDRVLVEITGRL